MRFGLSLPQRELGTDPIAIRDFVQTAEGLGFERLTVIDHVIGAAAPRPDLPWSAAYTVEHACHEPMTLLAFVAAVTRSIRLVTANIILPQRQTVLVAKQAAELDVLSGGRLTLGVGLGWSGLEYRALGMDFESRGRRIEEQVDVMRRLWTERTVSYDGRWHRFEEGGLNPGPIQRPIPVWFGADADPAIRRAARLGEGWLIFPLREMDDEGARKIDLFRETAVAAGRDPAALGIDATVYARDGDGPDGWIRRAERWRSLGATTITFRTSDSGLSTIDEHVAAMRALVGK